VNVTNFHNSEGTYVVAMSRGMLCRCYDSIIFNSLSTTCRRDDAAHIRRCSTYR